MRTSINVSIPTISVSSRAKNSVVVGEVTTSSISFHVGTRAVVDKAFIKKDTAVNISEVSNLQGSTMTSGIGLIPWYPELISNIRAYAGFWLDGAKFNPGPVHPLYMSTPLSSSPYCVCVDTRRAPILLGFRRDAVLGATSDVVRPVRTVQSFSSRHQRRRRLIHVRTATALIAPCLLTHIALLPRSSEKQRSRQTLTQMKGLSPKGRVTAFSICSGRRTVLERCVVEVRSNAH